MIVSIDGGTGTAAAVFSGPTPAITMIGEATPTQAMELLEWCVSAAEARGERLVVQVEDHYATIHMVKIRGRMVPKINMVALLKLVRLTEIWPVCAGLLGLEVVRTRPTVWQSAMFKGIPKTRAGVKLSTKQRATLAFAKQWPEVYRFDGVPERESLRIVKASRLNEHMRDSALMGRWLQLYGGKK